MKATAISGFALSVAMTLSAVLMPRAAAAEEFIIGTGSKDSIYDQTGRAICALVNRNVQELKCSALSTTDAVFNVDNVRTGALEFGIVPSDVQYHAVTKTGAFKFVDATYDEIRTVFSVPGETFTVVARRDSGIQGFDDLEGKRVNIGSPGSVPRMTMELLMAAKGWTRGDFQLVEELPPAEQSLAMCHDRVQAIVATVGHPADSIDKATRLCDAAIVEARGSAVDKLLAEKPYYAYTVIPGGVYDSNPGAVTTFGVRATLVTSVEVSADLVYALVKAVFENFDRLRRIHPAFGTLDKAAMTEEGLTAPLHEGARRYFVEMGIM